MTTILMKDFGRDHWSLLLYVETCILDNQRSPGIGGLDAKFMRVNPSSHPLHCSTNFPYWIKWDPMYGSRLKNYKDNSHENIVLDHDDIDCLEDLESAGLLKIVSLINLFVELTELGKTMCSQIRNCKISGGSYSTFEPQLSEQVEA